MQTTYLYAHRALERGVVPESEYVWLHSIAKNVCRWQQRTSLRRDRLVSDESADTVAAPEFGDGDTELLMGLQDALASIPESQRHALLLREWQGLSCDEVASKLGTSRAATNALLTRARRSLAKAMTAVPQLPGLGLDFGSLFVKLKALVAGGTAKVAATTLAVAGIAAGGVVAERTIVERDAPQPGRAGETLEPGVGSSSDVQRVSETDERNASADGAHPPPHSAWQGRHRVLAVRSPDDFGCGAGGVDRSSGRRDRHPVESQIPRRSESRWLRIRRTRI